MCWRLKGLVLLVCVGAGVALASRVSQAQNGTGGNFTKRSTDVVPAGEVAVFVPNGAVAYAEESTDLILARERANPTPAGGGTLPARHLPSYPFEKPQPLLEANAAPSASPLAAAAEMPGLAFDGPAVCGCEPPDPILTVGPSEVLMGINDQIQVVDKASGFLEWGVSWESFFTSAKPAGASFTSDPKVFFDPGSQRYFASILYINGAQTKSWWMLAASTSDTIGSSTVWRKWALDPTIAAPGLFADYTCFGFDTNAIYICTNMFAGASFSRQDMAVIPKAQLLVSTATPTFTQLTGITTSAGSSAFTIQPALMYGSGDCFFASTTGGTGSTIFFYRMNNPLTAPSLTKKALAVTSYSVPPNAPQLGGGTIDTLDARMLNAVWRNNQLWCAHPTAISGRAGARWYQFDTSAWPGSNPTQVQSGTVTDASASYSMPSIAVDFAGNAALGFTRCSSTERPSAWHTSRLVSDTLGTMGAQTLDHTGTAHYAGTRWGDYSGTAIDASDGVTFWMLQEYSKTGGDGWGTWCSSFAFSFPDVTAPSPDPMTWENPPHATSTTAIAMHASLATDVDSPPVEYFFEFVSGGPGGQGSAAWQSSQDFANSGLAVNTLYSYRVSARDSAPAPNQTSPTDTAGAYTFAEVPGAPLLSGATTNTLNVDVNPSTNPASTEFAIQCASTTDANWNGKYANAAGNPSATAIWQTDSVWGTIILHGLAANTQYCFQVKARNGDLIETAFSGPTCTSTLTGVLVGDMNCDGSVNFSDINPFVLYLSNFASWQATYPGCPPQNGDINSDGTYPSFADINPFVALLSGP